MRVSVGFDIGGSTIRAGLVALEGERWRVVDQRRELLSGRAKEPDLVVDAIVRIFEHMADAAGSDVRARHLGIGLCGQMTCGGRYVPNAPNLGWRDVKVADLLERALPGVTIRLDNDLNAILLGEQRFGAARGCGHVVAVYPGTGIGGAVMIDGHIVHGAAGFAGEIGHIFARGEIPCGCGQKGCVETIAGGRYIEDRVAADRAEGRLSSERFRGIERIRVDDVDRAYSAGDPYATALWDEVSAELVRLAATAVALLNPEMVLLGGGVIAHAPALAARLISEIPRCSPAVSGADLKVAVNELGEQAGILGAAVLAIDGS